MDINQYSIQVSPESIVHEKDIALPLPPSPSFPGRGELDFHLVKMEV